MTGVIYARYSSDNQREESIDGQLRECRQYAENNDIQIVGTYIDRAYSAKTDNRPEFQRMIKDSSKKLFDVAVVWKLDRFARNRYDSANYKNILKKNGVRLLSATENISDSPEGILLESVIEGMAEYYSAELGVKTLRGMKENAYKCKYNGGVIPLGYLIDENNCYIIDSITAPIVLDCFKRYAQGDSMQSIVEDLAIRGVQTRRGGKVTINVLSFMLHNRKYIGEYSFGDVVVQNGIPSIVTESLFGRVQERLASNRQAPGKYKADEEYLLTTKLYCGKCGTFMVGESGTSQTGFTHRYYKCISVKKHMGCDKKSVRKDWIEDIVVNEVQKVLSDDKLISRIVDDVLNKINEENTLLPLLIEQYDNVVRSIDNFLNAIGQGIITPSTKQRMDELEKEKATLAEQIAQERMARPEITKEQVEFWICSLRELNIRKIEHRRRLIDSFVNSVYLYDDRLIITFNYKDSAKAITLADIDKATKSSDLMAKAEPNKAAGLLTCRFIFHFLEIASVTLRFNRRIGC